MQHKQLQPLHQQIKFYEGLKLYLTWIVSSDSRVWYLLSPHLDGSYGSVWNLIRNPFPLSETFSSEDIKREADRLA